MEEALRIIISRSAYAAHDAIQTIQAIRAKSSTVAIRYANTLQMALADPEAHFTDEERAILADAIPSEDDGGRTFMLRVRLTQAERTSLFLAAERDGKEVSEYVRGRLFDGE